MDLKMALSKLEDLLSLVDEKLAGDPGTKTPFGREKSDRLTTLYGQVEEVIHQFDGIQLIEDSRGGGSPILYKDLVAAGFLSGRLNHQYAGRTQLVKVIGKVRLALESPGMTIAPASVESLVGTLQRFRACCEYTSAAPASEREVQDVIWIMLRAQFDRVDREATLAKFGAKAYRPDFGVPTLRALVEVKFVGPKTSVPEIQDQILTDASGYLTGNPHYSALIAVVYDAAHKLRDDKAFIEALRAVEGIVEVIVVPGIQGP
jgi:hypothetical protein